MGKKSVRVPKGKWFLVLLIVLIAVASLFGTKIILMINYLLGNDIVITLDADEQLVSLIRGVDKQLWFEATIQTNPFCHAQCSSTFTDISSGKVVNQTTFTIKPGKSLRFAQTIRNAKPGTGQRLYSLSMECKSSQTTLCHTSSEPTERTLIVVANYELSEEEKQLKASLNEQLLQLSSRIGSLQSEQTASQELAGLIGQQVSIPKLQNTVTSTNQIVSRAVGEFRGLKSLWDEQDYTSLSASTSKLTKEIELAAQNTSELNTSLQGILDSYNNLVSSYNQSRTRLEQLRHLVMTNPISTYDTSKLIEEFNAIAARNVGMEDLAKRTEELDGLLKKITLLESSTQQAMKQEAMDFHLQLDITKDALCSINATCLAHPSLEDRTLQENFELDQACLGVQSFRLTIESLNLSTSNRTQQQQDEIESRWASLRQHIVNRYLEGLLIGERNSDLIRKILGNRVKIENITRIENVSVDMRNALVMESLKTLPQCSVANQTLAELSSVALVPVVPPAVELIPLSVEFKEPQPECCVFGQCGLCCLNPSCRQNASNFPVVFLHGHAFNKGVSFEYSLDAFNKLQKKLEKDGFVNAGAVSTYATTPIPDGTLGWMNAPLTIKASYYFDVYKQPENYVIVQTKSQNIDSYVVRLKDIIDSISKVTGRPKVIIIAHSMGGLVARRYLQIFGSDKVDKLILVAVPNNGIDGKTADYCPIVGERLECDDMNADSLFINKLKSGQKPEIPVYNIVGTGCRMPKGLGDGIVTAEKALLDGANNSIVHGTCKGIDLLHTGLLNVDKFPEVYEIIRDALHSR